MKLEESNMKEEEKDKFKEVLKEKTKEDMEERFRDRRDMMEQRQLQFDMPF